MASVVESKTKSGKETRAEAHRLELKRCPHCGRKGYYKMPRRYEHCRFCGLHRILVPGQDF
ncbi:MAG TPA: hypothetical protein G4O01_07550 [Dehalococcoidia bacterium]|nr:hypothetical protein [Dehalococcoidia bacterium]